MAPKLVFLASLAVTIAVLANVYAKFQPAYPRQAMLTLAQARYEGPAVFSVGTPIFANGKPTSIKSIGKRLNPRAADSQSLRVVRFRG